MKYLYPGDLVGIITDRWNRVQKNLYGSINHTRNKESEPIRPAYPTAPFPSAKDLSTILDVIYHVSFLTEESRRTAVRVAYIVPGIKIMNLLKQPISFRNSLPFTVAEILRLAPAINPRNSMLAICPAEKMGKSHSNTPLVIWGILDHGSEYWRCITGKESAAIPPPNCLSVSTFTPGSLTVSSLGSILLRLRGGELLGPSLEGLGSGHIGDFLNNAAEALYNQTCKNLNRKKYHKEKDFDNHPRDLYFQTLENIVNYTQERGHGGTFVIFPDEISLSDQRLKDRITIKYPLTPPNIWKELISESVAKWSYFDQLFLENKSIEKLKSEIHWNHQMDSIREKIADFEQFISMLAGVDGAVVLTKHLNILGFGAEITATSPSLRIVKIANDSKAKKFTEKSINQFGTRHRSALRLCSSFEKSMCLVISQDGNVRAIKRVGPELYMWDDINLNRFGF